MKIWQLVIILFLFINSTHGQELNCNVVVNLSPNVQANDRSLFRDMEKEFAQFLNNRKWTDDNFGVEERIDCNLLITIESMNGVSSFEATAQIQSARPIYNSNYNSILLNLAQNYADDDWNFNYVTSQPMEFNENNLQNNITALLAYYAYIIIGIDYDSFSKLGGTVYYETARKIAINADQQFTDAGWQQFVNPPRNRHWLAENLNNPQMQSVREALYDYHRMGLDNFQNNPDESRTVILEAIKKIRSAYQTTPNAFLITLFLYGKGDEIINIFSKGDLAVRREVYNLLVQMQPTKTTEFQKIISN